MPAIESLYALTARTATSIEELAIRARKLEEGGPKLWDEFMDELRETHLGMKRKSRLPRQSVFARMQAAYEGVVAKRKK